MREYDSGSLAICRTCIAGLACATVTALIACGGGYVASPVACGNDDGFFPAERLADWKSYADHVALVRVTSGRDEGARIPDPVLTLDVQDTYWSGRAVPSLPSNVDVHTRANMLDDRDYVTPLVRLETDKVWLTLSCTAPVPIENGNIAGSEPRRPGFKPLRDRLADQPPEVFRRLMNQAQVRPEVRKYLHLRPEERARRVYERP